MKKLKVIGNLWGSSGYASHTRQLLNGLNKVLDVSFEGPRFPDMEKQLTDNELVIFKKEPFVNENILAIGLPNQWRLNLCDPHKKFFGYCVWEGTKVPKFWINIFNDKRVDYVIVPSSHTKQAILNTDGGLVVKDKIVIVPHGVDKGLFYPGEKRNPGIFRFVANKGWSQGERDRGGLQFLFRAFRGEFKEDEPVELLVKLNLSYAGPGWNLNTEMANLNLPESGGKININWENVSLDKLRDFYLLGDVFVSPNMGEAFSLPCAEALACGLPVVTTNFGGQTDYVNEKNGWLLPYSLVLNDWDNMYEGVEWALPDLEALKRLLRRLYEHPEEVKAKKVKCELGSWVDSARIIADLCD